MRAIYFLTKPITHEMFRFASGASSKKQKADFSERG
jgi:hypothetical protein